jgi:Zn-dependent protease with chaperone function
VAVQRGLAALSLLVMPVLAAAQRRAGREFGSAAAVADSKQTLLCAYLSAVLLAGLVANATLGWWWADPTAALAIAAMAVKEPQADSPHHTDRFAGVHHWYGRNLPSRTTTTRSPAGSGTRLTLRRKLMALMMPSPNCSCMSSLMVGP